MKRKSEIYPKKKWKTLYGEYEIIKVQEKMGWRCKI